MELQSKALLHLRSDPAASATSNVRRAAAVGHQGAAGPCSQQWYVRNREPPRTTSPEPKRPDPGGDDELLAAYSQPIPA
jgi:hypothetical protein